MNDSADLFPTTRYSVIDRSAADHERFLEGFGDLFRIYRQPIYCCIRRYGLDHEDAEDLLQSYFRDLQRRDYVAAFDRNRGRFRAFIQTDLRFFLNNEARKLRTRSGAFIEEENQLLSADPDLPMDRDWAVATFTEAIETACRECGKTETRVKLFKALAPLLDKEPTPGQYDQLSLKFGKSPQSLAVDMSRLRKSFGRALERLVRSTLNSANHEEVRAEIGYLFASMQGEHDTSALQRGK
jgi:DNA-directed RNA polymerase specialized sigma24 family protein